MCANLSAPLPVKASWQSRGQWAGLAAEAPGGEKALGRGAALGSPVPDARVKPKALAPPAGRGQHCRG